MNATNHISLSQLTSLIRETLDDAFRDRSFWVVADVTNHSYKETTNYHYFELVEKIPGKGDILAKISAKAWGEGSFRIAAFEKATGQRFGSNIRVLANVSVVYHPKWGLQLELHDLDTRFTLGAIEEQRQATLRRLVTDNPGVVQLVDGAYITQNQQLRLPVVIQTIALVSALQSAGAEDFRHTLEYNDHGYRFRIDEYHTAVQGENNAEAFVDCLVSVFTSGIPYDVVVITRGGGAQSDFLIFDHYMIGLAVAKFPIPVITGIGHQKNETIADLMAHTALKTPTKSAEFIIAHNKSFEDKILALRQSVVIRSQQCLGRGFRDIAAIKSSIINQGRDILAQEKETLTSVRQTVTARARDILYSRRGEIQRTASMLASRPVSILSNRQNDLRHLVGNLQGFNARYLKNQRGYLGHLQSLVRTMSPDNILKKGFALVKVDGRITSNPEDLAPGKDMDIILSDAQITSTVISKTPYHGDEFNI